VSGLESPRRRTSYFHVPSLLPHPVSFCYDVVFSSFPFLRLLALGHGLSCHPRFMPAAPPFLSLALRPFTQTGMLWISALPLPPSPYLSFHPFLFLPRSPTPPRSMRMSFLLSLGLPQIGRFFRRRIVPFPPSPQINTSFGLNSTPFVRLCETWANTPMTLPTPETPFDTHLKLPFLST